MVFVASPIRWYAKKSRRKEPLQRMPTAFSIQPFSTGPIGFIPQTLTEYDDPLDVLLIYQEAVAP